MEIEEELILELKTADEIHILKDCKKPEKYYAQVRLYLKAVDKGILISLFS